MDVEFQFTVNTGRNDRMRYYKTIRPYCREMERYDRDERFKRMLFHSDDQFLGGLDEISWIIYRIWFGLHACFVVTIRQRESGSCLFWVPRL